MATAYIGLGSNLHDPYTQLQKARHALSALPETELFAFSSIYQSAPLEALPQPDYLNAVAGLMTALTPIGLLQALQAIETAQGRVRTVRYDSRTLDLDLLLYDDEIIETPELKVPHPGLLQRHFVLYPLLEVAPHVCLPNRTPLSDYLQHVPCEGLIRYEKN